MSLALLVTISHAMMGPKQDRQGKLFYTSFNIDDRIRPDNPLRKTHQLLDFSWIRPATAEMYGSTGRPTVDPIMLLVIVSPKQALGQQTLNGIDIICLWTEGACASG